MGHVPVDAAQQVGIAALTRAQEKAGRITRTADSLAGLISFLSRLSGAIAAAAIMAMALLTSYDVALRYLFNSPTIWITETCAYLLILCAMFAAVYTMHERGHIAVELVYGRFSSQTQVTLTFVTSLIALSYVAVLTWNGLDMTITAFQMGGGHIGDMNMPQWMTFQIIPWAGGLLGLELIRQCYLIVRAPRGG